MKIIIKKNMKKIFILFLLSNYTFVNSQDYKLDNVTYKTISWNDFFEKLEKNPKTIFFDIRTPGERNDNSEYLSYNQGKIKGAIETDFNDFKKYYSEYLKYKNDTIYLYCSHSRRSRLLAKQLADSSFTKVVSINGGLSYLNNYKNQKISLLANKYYVNNLNYKLISPLNFIKKIKDKSVLLIDVRTDSIFNGISKNEWENSFGTIKKAMHIPFDKIEENYHKIDTAKEIILFDNDGEKAPVVAHFFYKKGIKVNVLFYGLDNLQSTVSSKDIKFLKSKYKTILPSELLEFINQSNTVIIDTRTEAEFMSKDSIEWKNIGRIKNAINIPLSKLTKEKLQEFKNKKIILYDIMMQDELFDYAKQLNEFEINNFYLLSGGIYFLNWQIANTEEKELEKILENTRY
jgi:rhodanese-related sulfurtransferase